MDDQTHKTYMTASDGQPDDAERSRLIAQARNQKELFESLINSSFDGILAFDRECRYTIWNRGMERISGVPAAQVLGRVAFDVFPFLKENGEDRFLYDALDGKTVLAHDRQFIVPETGQQGFFEAHYAPLCTADGDVIGGLAVVRDITAGIKAQQALRDSEARYRMLVEEASDGIAVYDLQGRIVNVNTAGCEMIGYKREEMIGRPVTDFIDPGDLAQTPLRWEELKSGRAALGERVLLHKNGTPLCVELSARMLANGQVQTIIRDITRRKEAEEEIKRLNAELERRVIARTAQLEAANKELQKQIAERERLEALKDEFLAIASHELRTPISVIKGYTKIALRSVEEGGDPRLVRHLRIVDEKTDQLTRLVNEVLDASSIEGEHIPLQKETFDLCQVVQHATNDVELTSPDFIFTADLPPEPVYVFADRQRIEQVVNNFLSNAVKYTGRYTDGVRPIEVSLTLEGGEAVVAVRDYGVGIPAEQTAKVFGRFFRADNVTNARYPYPGMGLGLFISYNIVQQHGGRMWVESAEGAGSTFFFSLPLHDPAR